jgi:hypothetical protein
MELQLQILTWGVTTAADEETTEEAIKALSGVKPNTRLQETLYDQDMHRMIFERLQQKLRPSNKSSLVLTSTPQVEAALLALLRIEQLLNLNDHRVSSSHLPSEIVVPPNWEEFRPCLQPLAFSLRIHMLINRNSDDQDELWLQRTEALNRMAQNPSMIYVRKLLLFAALRGLLKGDEYIRKECGIVLSRLLMTREYKNEERGSNLLNDSLVGTFEEIMKILDGRSEMISHGQGPFDNPELSEKILYLLSCEDEASRRAGGRIMILLVSHSEHQVC